MSKGIGKSAVYNTRLYKIWGNMIQRCTNPNNTHYSYYGGKGVTVCTEWARFEDFKEWALANGYREDLTLDREDGDKGYDPSNCRWITRKEQMFNISSNRRFEAKGEIHTVTEWAEITGININTLTKRLNLGWSGDRLLNPPDRRYQRDYANCKKKK